MKIVIALLVALSGPGVARAQTEEAPVCTDRPAKANAVCTVPPGRAQLETGALGWSLTEAGATRMELLTVASSLAKVGLTGRSDLQIGFTPYAELRTSNGSASERRSGFGDMLVRYKHRLTREEARVQLALIPFVKLPTARGGLGNGEVEAGLAVPIAFRLAGPVTMTLGPEVGWLADADRSGRHLALVNLVNLSLPVAKRWTIVGELWTNLNFDPTGTVGQASADAALVYTASNRVQLDLGGNAGLTRDTPDLELYAGFSIKF